MREIKLTCPFTGAEFTALEYADGRIVFKHPLTGEEMVMNWNCSNNRYYLRKGAFRHIRTLDIAETADYLGVSRQRVSKMAKDQTIMPHTIAGKTVFLFSDVVKYKETRKVGAPYKGSE